MMKANLKQKALNSAIYLLKKGIQVFGINNAALIRAKIVEELVPIFNQETKHGILNFFCPGELPVWRAQTLLTKEPETIEWINNFIKNDVFWDIGANVGVYSLYAALRGMTVVSFEPSPSNYYVLSRNIEINKMDDRVFALCIALSDATRLDAFYMTNTELGGALNSFAEAIDWKGVPFTASFKQAMIGFSIDDFIQQFNPLFPNHIKIDVDGIENKIIKGAKHTLSDKRVKSVLVELDSSREDYCKEIIGAVEKAGLKFSEKKHASMFDKGQFSDGYNYIFVRK